MFALSIYLLVCLVIGVLAIAFMEYTEPYEITWAGVILVLFVSVIPLLNILGVIFVIREFFEEFIDKFSDLVNMSFLGKTIRTKKEDK